MYVNMLHTHFLFLIALCMHGVTAFIRLYICEETLCQSSSFMRQFGVWVWMNKKH